MNTSTFREARTTTDIVQLAAQARLAYEQKQARECMALIRQILLADEDNTEAHVLQDAIRSDIQRDFEDAQALLEDSRKRDDGQKYRKAAEIILLKILYLDPTHAEAKALLSGVKSGTEPHVATAFVETQRRRPAADDIGFTAQPEPVEQMLDPNRGRRRVPLILVVPVLILLAGGIFFYRSSRPAGSAVPAASAATPAKTIPAAPALLESTLADADTDTKATNSLSSPTAESRVPPVASTLPEPPAPPATPAVAAPGTIAVTSSIAADIYMGDKFLGATPANLQLAAGRYTLEYRHGNLRTVMTHEVKSKRTTPVVVTFETTVLINARPWAQVFLEGTSRQALGQTPLSSVRVPVGSVLTFENPNFPPKSHRVTETDSTIQMAFP